MTERFTFTSTSRVDSTTIVLTLLSFSVLGSRDFCSAVDVGTVATTCASSASGRAGMVP